MLLTQYSAHISSLCANLLLVTWCLFSLTHKYPLPSSIRTLKSFSCFRTGENWPMEVCRGSLWWPLRQVGSRNSSHTKYLSSYICLISQTTMRHISHNFLPFSVRHEPPHGVNPVDIHGYEPPWKALSEFAMHQNLDRMDPSGPQFQHLVGQVSQNVMLIGVKISENLKFMVKCNKCLDKKQAGFVCTCCLPSEKLLKNPSDRCNKLVRYFLWRLSRLENLKLSSIGSHKTTSPKIKIQVPNYVFNQYRG